MRYFIYFSYDGKAYHGWQIQPNANSVQEVLNKALTTLLREDIHVVGAGRTDTGVHAFEMVAHFDVSSVDSALDLSFLVYKLGKILPPDIQVIGITPVMPKAHARFDALERTYHYYLSTQRNPFLRSYTLYHGRALNFERMNLAAQELLKVVDFSSFSKSNTDTLTNNCCVKEAYWQEVKPNLWRFSITADRFLRNMVRAIVGTLLEVGLEKLTIDDFIKILEMKNRCAAGESVDGRALFLVRVSYPLAIFPNEQLPTFLNPILPTCII